jgi:hypothetical protein
VHGTIGLDQSSNYKKSRLILFLLVSIIVVTLIIDISILRIARLGGWEFQNWQTIILFILMSSAFAAGQYFILQFIKRITDKEIKVVVWKKLSLTTFRKAVWAIQYAQAAILCLVILQMVLYSNYSSAAVTTVTSISYVTAFVMMALLSYKFFLWFNQKRTKDDLAIFLYAISSAALAINIAVAIALEYELAPYKPAIMSPYRTGQLGISGSASLDIVLHPLYTITSIIGFVLMWAATATVLRPHSQRLGHKKYWFLVSIPLVYFISQFLNLFLSQLTYVIVLYPILFTLLFVFTKPAGGILFGAAFSSIAKSSLPDESVGRDYMTLAAYGVMMFFVAIQNTAAQMAYPPFGLIGASFVGLSAYLMFLGLYSSAISISQDITLRKTIRNSAVEASKLLDSIGTAQMEQELQKRVLNIVKEHSDSMTEESGVQPSLTQDDMKEYLDMVVKEIKRTKA